MKQDLRVVGIAIAKRVFHVVGMDTRGQIIFRKRFMRGAVLSCMAKVPQATVGMDACGGAHYWARRLHPQGHDVKLMAPQYVKPSVKTNHNARRDAEAIADAVTRPTMRFVPVTAVDQHAIQALHRVRARLIGARTALVNDRRGLVAEYGLVLPKGMHALRTAVGEQRDTEQGTLTPVSQELFPHRFDALVQWEARVSDDDETRHAMAHSHPACQRLVSVPGIGPLTATALMAAVGDGGACKHGRQLAAWLGVVPTQHATGGQTRL